jgi:hypothetical protein
MKCENCKEIHDGSYGSGRFCEAKCARGFSTKGKREEINSKVSKKLKGNRYGGSQIQKGTPAYEKWIDKIKVTWAKKRQKKIEEMKKLPFEEWSRDVMISQVSNDQEHACNKCKNTHWIGEVITLELEHIDGNNRNDKRYNLELLCPNCHSLTNTWRGRNKKGRENIGRVSDSELLKALRECSSTRQALIMVGLSPKGNNYLRCKKLLGQTE